jgi:hypothetical protein
MTSSSPESLEAFAAGDRAHTRAIVHKYVRACGSSGTTADQGSLALGLLTNSVAPRLHDLERDGLIVKLEVLRKTRSGCLAAVYTAAEFTQKTTSNAEAPGGTLFGDLAPAQLAPENRRCTVPANTEIARAESRSRGTLFPDWKGAHIDDG